MKIRDKKNRMTVFMGGYLKSELIEGRMQMGVIPVVYMITKKMRVRWVLCRLILAVESKNRYNQASVQVRQSEVNRHDGFSNRNAPPYVIKIGCRDDARGHGEFLPGLHIVIAICKKSTVCVFNRWDITTRYV